MAILVHCRHFCTLVFFLVSCQECQQSEGWGVSGSCCSELSSLLDPCFLIPCQTCQQRRSDAAAEGRHHRNCSCCWTRVSPVSSCSPLVMTWSRVFVFMLCPRVVSSSCVLVSCRLLGSCPCVVPSCCVSASCPRVVPSRRVLVSYIFTVTCSRPAFVSCPRLQNVFSCRALVSCPRVAYCCILVSCRIFVSRAHAVSPCRGFDCMLCPGAVSSSHVPVFGSLCRVFASCPRVLLLCRAVCGM